MSGESHEARSLAEALPLESARVRDKLIPRYEGLRGMPHANVEPALFLMRASIKRAEEATAAGDVVGMLRAYEDLRGCSE